MSTHQEPETTGEVQPTFEEMKHQIDDQRRDILAVLNADEIDALNTSDLREYADVPSGSMTHHTKLLERWGLIEEVDRVYIGQGSRAILWELTERGEQFCDSALDEIIPSLASPAEVREMQEQITELEAQIELLNQRLDEEVNAAKDDMIEALNRLKSGTNSNDDAQIG